MKKIILLFGFIGLMSSGFAQLNLNSSATATELAGALVGTGMTFSNATLTCPTGASGLFTGGATTILGIDSGIVLTSGLISNAVGPNNATGLGTSNGAAGDASLDAIISPQVSHDACVLEFDIIPICDTLRFDYVFASEEYPEYSCGNVNDVFGFFVSGPGIMAPDTNIALVPGTLTPVTISTINGVLGCGDATGNTTCCNSNPFLYVSNTGGTTLQYDGLTTVLTAYNLVQSCVPYHIKLAIGDGGDFVFDSGVFLKRGTLNCFGVHIVASTTGTSGTDAVEGCQDGNFHMCLSAPMPTAYTFHYTVGGSASFGIDYAAFPDSVVFPADSQCVNLAVIPVIDGILEGTETIKLFYNPSQCAPFDSAYINIQDIYLINATPDTLTLCSGDSAQIGLPFVAGSTYTWSPTTGLSDPTVALPWVKLYNTDTIPIVMHYMVSTAILGCSNFDTIRITVNGFPSDAAGSDVTICNGASIDIGTPPHMGYGYQWSPTTGLVDTLTSATSVSLTNAGLIPDTKVYVLSAGYNGCFANDTMNVTVNPIPHSDPGPTVSVCAGAQAQIGTAPLTGYNYLWSPATGLSSTQSSLTNVSLNTAGTYFYQLWAGWIGCADSAGMTLVVKALPESHPGTEISICPGVPGQIGADPTSGTTYLWSPTTGLSNAGASNPDVTLTNTTNDIVANLFSVLTTYDGCQSSATVTVNVRPNPEAKVKGDADTVCLDKPFVLTYDGTPLTDPHYTWGFGNGTVVSGSGVGPYTMSWSDVGSKTITLMVSDYSCPSNTDSLAIVVIDCSVTPTNILTPNGDGNNDAFKIFELDKNPNSRLVIFNRWGKKVYETDYYKNDWNGGSDITAGVYFYIFTLVDGTEKHGTITIMK